MSIEDEKAAAAPTQAATDKLREWWNSHFAEAGAGGDDSEDWFADFGALRPLLTTLLTPTAGSAPHRPKPRILIVGCGNSTLAADLIDSGLADDVACVDIADVVIAQMQAKYARSHPQLRWHVGDVCDLNAVFPGSGVFDVVLDKGTADTLLFRCHGRAERDRQLNAYMREMQRLLRRVSSSAESAAHDIVTPTTGAAVANAPPPGRFVWLTMRMKPPFKSLVDVWEIESAPAPLAADVQLMSYSTKRKVLWCHVCRPQPSRAYAVRRAFLDARIAQRRYTLQSSARAWAAAPPHARSLLPGSVCAAADASASRLLAYASASHEDSVTAPRVCLEQLLSVPLLDIDVVCSQYASVIAAECGRDMYCSPAQHSVSIVGRILRYRKMSRLFVFADLVPASHSIDDASAPRVQIMFEWWTRADDSKPRPEQCISEEELDAAQNVPLTPHTLELVRSAYPPGIECAASWRDIGCLKANDIVWIRGVPGRSLNGTFSLRAHAMTVLALAPDDESE